MFFLERPYNSCMQIYCKPRLAGIMVLIIKTLYLAEKIDEIEGIFTPFDPKEYCHPLVILYKTKPNQTKTTKIPQPSVEK